MIRTNIANTGPDPLREGAYHTIDEAISALTRDDLKWLSRLAARRLDRLRSHQGLARYLAGIHPDELVDEAISRIESGTRRVKPNALTSHQAFMNFVQSVINSVVNNFTRHAEPHIEHIDAFELGLNGTDDVRRNIEERDWLDWIFRALRHNVSLELKEELCRLSRTLRAGIPAQHLVQECSDRLLTELRREVQRSGLTPPDFQPELGN